MTFWKSLSILGATISATVALSADPSLHCSPSPGNSCAGVAFAIPVGLVSVGDAHRWSSTKTQQDEKKSAGGQAGTTSPSAPGEAEAMGTLVYVWTRSKAEHSGPQFLSN